MSLTLERAQATAAMLADELWTRHDAGVIETLLTEDIVYQDVAFGYRFEGRLQVRSYFDQCTRSMADFSQQLVTVLPVNENTLVTHWFYSGTFRDAGLKLECPIRLPGYSVITLRGNQIASVADYYSGIAFVEALGLNGHTPQTFIALRAAHAKPN